MGTVVRSHRPGESRTPAIAEQLFFHAANRAEPYTPLSASVLNSALRSENPAVRLARHLYDCSNAIQRADDAHTAVALGRAGELLPAVSDPRLRWWFFQSKGIVAAEAQDYAKARRAFELAISIASEASDLAREKERSYVNLIFSLCSAGVGEDVASTLLTYVRQKESTSLGPSFYQITSYVLHWLGEYELAYRLRFQSVEVLRPTGGRLARDWRGLARTLVALGRLREAEHYLNLSLGWIHNGTSEDAFLTRDAAVDLAVAKGDFELARQHLDAISRQAPIGHRHAPAYFRLAQALQARGEYEESALLVHPFDRLVICPEFEPWRLALSAEIAVSRNDPDTALRLYQRATELGRLRPARADTQAMICGELGPWLNVADPDAVVPSVLEVPRDYRNRWLTATARDMRRSIAPSRLAPHTKVPRAKKIAALRSTIEELRLIGEFLADAALAPDVRRGDDFWALHDAVDGILRRRGAVLHVAAQIGDPVELAAPGLAGRLAFGLIAVLAEHAREGTTIELQVAPRTIHVTASGLDQHAVDRFLADVKHLRSHYRSTDRVAAFAAFLATYLIAASNGWTMGARSPRRGSVAISIELANGAGERVDRSRASPEHQGAQPRDRDMPKRPDGAPELVAALEQLHERRFEHPRLDRSLIDRARAVGDVDVLASALLIGSCTELLSQNCDRAEALFAELTQLIDAHPRLAREIWPDPVFVGNRGYALGDAVGDHQARWIHAARLLVDATRIDEPEFRMIGVNNWCEAEIDRGVLSSAWRFAALCDRTGTSARGRNFELGLQTKVLLVEGRFAAANVAATERRALERASGTTWRPETLVLEAITHAKIGRFDDAHRIIDEIVPDEFTILVPDVEAVRALVFYDEGRHDEAYAACQSVRHRLPERYATASLSSTVSIEAAILLERGELDEASAVLDGFERDRHHLYDLPFRLEVEARLACEREDRDRQLDVARQRFALAQGQPRWDARQLPLYREFWTAMERAVERDREQLDAELGVVAAVVTHDLNNALASAVLAVDLAERNADEDLLLRVDRAFESICTLADQLDLVARLDGVSSVPDRSLVDVGALLRSVQYPNKAIYARQGGSILVTTDLPEGLLVPIQGNVLEIMVSNLVGNAIKHGRPGGLIRVGATFTPGAAGKEGVVTVSVDDDGPGIPKRQAERLLRPQPDPRSPTAGLGLWIVRRYASVLGLGVDVGTSALGGARVALHISLGESTVDWSDVPADIGGGNEGPSQRVLVVEDDALLAAFIVAALREADKDVTVVSTATQAEARLDRESFDVILADIELADGSTGFDVLAAASARGHEPYVVVMSGQAAHQTRVDMAKRFGKTFTLLQKPFTLAALSDAIG